MKQLTYIGLAILSVLYIINPGMGVFEFIPDNLPIVGNIDEAFAIGVFLYAMRNLGFDLNEFFSKKEDKKKSKKIIIE